MKYFDTDIVILGAGLTGLTIADLLMQSGRDITLLERDSQVGGLAKTIEYKDFRFDLGGHRLCFQNNTHLQYVKSILGDSSLISHKRKSSIFLNGKFLPYPPALFDSFSYGMANAANFIFENLAFFRKKRKNITSLKEWVCFYFGSTIHEIYFKDYSQKVWGLRTDEMSAAWAERRIGYFDGKQLVKDIFAKSKSIKENTPLFYYPSLGIGSICEGLVRKLNGKVRLSLSVEISRIDAGDRKLESLTYNQKGECFILRFKHLISAIPLASFYRFIFWSERFKQRLPINKIRYRSLVLVYLILNQEKVFNEHWVYFPEKDIIFARISEPKNWSKDLAKDERTTICLEIFCDYNDSIWHMPDNIIIDRVIAVLEKKKIVSRDKILDGFIKKVPFAYPLLYLGYQGALKSVLQTFSKWKNLSLTGRSGTHSYYDIEECIEDAYRVVNSLGAPCKQN